MKLKRLIYAFTMTMCMFAVSLSSGYAQDFVVDQQDVKLGKKAYSPYLKGWLDSRGPVQEKIYDMAVSDGREIVTDGRCKTPVGDTVDVANASYTNTIGDAADEKVFGSRNAPPETLRKQRDRAYTSPIWYTPNGTSQN